MMYLNVRGFSNCILILVPPQFLQGWDGSRRRSGIRGSCSNCSDSSSSSSSSPGGARTRRSLCLVMALATPSSSSSSPPCQKRPSSNWRS